MQLQAEVCVHSPPKRADPGSCWRWPRILDHHNRPRCGPGELVRKLNQNLKEKTSRRCLPPRGTRRPDIIALSLCALIWQLQSRRLSIGPALQRSSTLISSSAPSPSRLGAVAALAPSSFCCRSTGFFPLSSSSSSFVPTLDPALALPAGQSSGRPSGQPSHSFKFDLSLSLFARALYSAKTPNSAASPHPPTFVHHPCIHTRGNPAPRLPAKPPTSHRSIVSLPYLLDKAAAIAYAGRVFCALSCFAICRPSPAT